MSRVTREGGQAPPEPPRVPDRERLPVVVEVGVHLDLAPPVRQPSRPLLELRLGIVAPPPARAMVEADERPVGGERVRLEPALGMVLDNERDAVLAQQVADRGVEPARVTELEAVAPR